MPSRSPLDALSPEQRNALASLTPDQLRALTLPLRSIRRRSNYEFLGLPLYMVATGPDPAKRELRGHAKGIIAIGDIATGFIAIGGWARGVIAIGGLATGVAAIGGLAVGLAGAFGGLALSAFLALGGGAIGNIAVGGGAVGEYAMGGAAFGEHVLSVSEQDPEAVRFFNRYGMHLNLPGYQAAPRRHRS